MGLEGLTEVTEVKNEQTFAEWLKAHTPSPEAKQRLRALARAANASLGIPDGPLDVTPEELLERQVRNGLNPEDRIFQKELMRMRYGTCDEEP